MTGAQARRLADGDVVVDLGTTRITIGAGADVATVALVLTLLGGRA